MTPRKLKSLTEFEVGDLVRVIEGTHDPALPSHRVGLVVEIEMATWPSVSAARGTARQLCPPAAPAPRRRAAMLRIMHGRKPHGGDFGGPLRLALVRNVEPENRRATVAQAAQRPTFS